MSDDKVKLLRNVNEQPDEYVVAALEDALELARSGRMRSVAIAAVLTENVTFTTHSTRDLNEAIGIVGYLHYELCTKLYNTSAD